MEEKVKSVKQKKLSPIEISIELNRLLFLRRDEISEEEFEKRVKELELARRGKEKLSPFDYSSLIYDILLMKVENKRISTLKDVTKLTKYSVSTVSILKNFYKMAEDFNYFEAPLSMYSFSALKRLYYEIKQKSHPAYKYIILKSIEKYIEILDEIKEVVVSMIKKEKFLNDTQTMEWVSFGIELKNENSKFEDFKEKFS